jgi:capsular polysaccharide biosynthesis protein
MELKAYWVVIWRRIWMVILIVGIVALYAGYQYYHLRKTPGALKAYSSSTTLQVGLQATTSGDINNADYVTVSEALADSLATGPILNSKEFDTDVSKQIRQDMSQIEQRYGPNPDLGDWQNASAIGSALNAVRVHSLVTITVNWATPAGAWAIARAIGEISTSRLGTYLDYVVSTGITHPASQTFTLPDVTARVISNASDPAPTSGSATSKLVLLGVLLLVALGLAIALVFLLDYLDDRLYHRGQVKRLLDLPVLGEIPARPTTARR